MNNKDTDWPFQSASDEQHKRARSRGKLHPSLFWLCPPSLLSLLARLLAPSSRANSQKTNKTCFVTSTKPQTLTLNRARSHGCRWVDFALKSDPTVEDQWAWIRRCIFRRGFVAAIDVLLKPYGSVQGLLFLSRACVVAAAAALARSRCAIIACPLQGKWRSRLLQKWLRMLREVVSPLVCIRVMPWRSGRWPRGRRLTRENWASARRLCASSSGRWSDSLPTRRGSRSYSR